MAQTKTVREEEYREFANTFVDLLLDRRKEWLFFFIWNDGLATVPTDDQLHSGALAAKIALTVCTATDWLIPENIFEAYKDRDREPLIEWIFHRTKQAALTREAMTRVLAIGKDKPLQRSLKDLKAVFSFQRGPTTKLPPSKYRDALRTADTLRPCIASLLSEMEADTKHSLREMLEYRKTDFLKASAFLLKHLSSFETALKDEKLRARGKKPATRARVLADALAGSGYRLSFRTSYDRVGQARRSSKRVR